MNYVDIIIIINIHNVGQKLRTNLEVLSSKQLDAHYGKYEPEDKTHEQHIEDGGYRLH